jgi:hypothetical protein
LKSDDFELLVKGAISGKIERWEVVADAKNGSLLKIVGMFPSLDSLTAFPLIGFRLD